MKFVEGFVSAVKGNVTTKLNDPLIGSFIASFMVCNWKHFLVLILGNDKLENRVVTFESAMTPSGDNWFFQLSMIFLLPLTLALVYVIAMPWVSIWIANLVMPAEIIKHGVAVDLEIEQAKKQRALNEEKLLGDRNNVFLPEIVKNRIKQKELETERRQAETEVIKNEAEITKANNEKAQSELNVQKEKESLEKERNTTQTQIEKNKLKVSVAETKGMMSANAHASAFVFVHKLSELLAEDDLSITVESLTEIVSAIFGYKNFEMLLGDFNFNNESLRALKYIEVNSNYFAGRLENILSNDPVDSNLVDSNSISDYVYAMFEDMPYYYGSIENIAETIYEEAQENQYDIMDSDSFSSAQAESDTTYGSIDFDGFKTQRKVGAVEVIITGSASGSHYREAGVGGRDMNFSLIAELPVRWGQFGLASYETRVDAELREYEDVF